MTGNGNMDISRIGDRRVREAIQKLSHKNQEVIFMRFWDLLTIEVIAQKMRLTWADTDRLIDCSLNLLKRVLLNDLKGRNINLINGDLKNGKHKRKKSD